MDVCVDQARQQRGAAEVKDVRVRRRIDPLPLDGDDAVRVDDDGRLINAGATVEQSGGAQDESPLLRHGPSSLQLAGRSNGVSTTSGRS